MEVGDPGGGAFVRSLCHCGYFPVDLNWVDKLSAKGEVPANGVVYIRAGVQPVCFGGPLPSSVLIISSGQLEPAAKRAVPPPIDATVTAMSTVMAWVFAYRGSQIFHEGKDFQGSR